MGSIVISDVGRNHFPYNTTMFGANPHLPQHDSSQLQVQHRASSSTRSQHLDVASPHTQVDTPMADVAAPSQTSASSDYRSQRPSAHQSDVPPQPSRAQPPPISEPPPSPRFKPQSSQQTPTQAGPAAVPRPAVVPSSSTSSSAHPSPKSNRSLAESTAASPHRIKVQSLSHIQSFAADESSPFSQTRSARRARQNPNDIGPQYEISEMPVTDIIEMVAGLLTKITTTNDRQHEHLHRQIPPPEGASSLSQQTSSVLAFHGKNVPTISILSYLSRVHKYCPTTYEVFLSLLVYFDRMTERVNSGPMQSLRQANQQSLERAAAASEGSRHSSISVATLGNSSPVKAQDHVQAATPPPSGSLGKPAAKPSSSSGSVKHAHPPSPPNHIDPPLGDSYNLSHFFVVDSFNIHRLVIAGVTCASKFFSDIFYTNSRYAKVGGLPLNELNHLELQFLLLNDFRLAVPLEEMEAYGTMLVEFYAREVVAQQQ
ncbi:cyclin-domain-containing protein, partial [Saccharata proteae CBS 121410]